jgi:DNA-binding transcriptional MerR regulator
MALTESAPRRGSYRMKDLCELTGLPRQVVHFYIQQGLVPEGHKTGPNMAYYGEEHLERIRLVRRLQHERFLPLKAIRAVLGAGPARDEEKLSPAQRGFIAEVRDRLGGPFAPKKGARETVDAREVMLRAGVDRKDFDDLCALGVLATVPGPRKKTLIAKDDAWMIELWGEVRKAGFTRARGFGAETFAIFEEAISAMFDKEARFFTERLSSLPPEEAAAMVERARPLIHTFLVRYHDTKVRNFFNSF